MNPTKGWRLDSQEPPLRDGEGPKTAVTTLPSSPLMSEMKGRAGWGESTRSGRA